VTDTSTVVQRRVRTEQAPDGASRTVVISRPYNGSIEDVWDAVTSAERIARWFMPVSGELRLGGRFELQIGHGTIERCDPPNGFRTTWEYGDSVTWLEVRLTAESETRTILELEHIGMVEDAKWAQFGPGAVGVGWDGALMALGRHFDTPDAPKPEPATWAASDEGRQFITLSSQGWCDANIEAGTDPEQARAAAERTTAFYLGG
jgi:uncharacterized protein YndB with AHSA1/START domain